MSINLTSPITFIPSSDGKVLVQQCRDWCVGQLDIAKFNDLHIIVLTFGIILTMIAFTEFKYIRDMYWLDAVIKGLAMCMFAAYLILNL